MKKIVFMCVANSARSQMAEGLARHFLPSDIEVLSAGSVPSALHPYAVQVMSEIGIDIGHHYAKAIDDIDSANVDTVVTLCADEVCPVFLGKVKRMHWPLNDPASGSDIEGEAVERFRNVRDQLKQKILVLSE